jgi:hypothetical protein
MTPYRSARGVPDGAAAPVEKRVICVVFSFAAANIRTAALAETVVIEVTPVIWVAAVLVV